MQQKIQLRQTILYFFFGNDNENHYSATYEEHQAAMAQFGVQYGESTE